MSQYAESRPEFHPWICNWIYQLRLEEMSEEDRDWIRRLQQEKLIPEDSRKEKPSERQKGAKDGEQPPEPKRKPT